MLPCCLVPDLLPRTWITPLVKPSGYCLETGNLPESLLVSVGHPDSHHVTTNHPDSSSVTGNLHKSSHVSTDRHEAIHISSDHPEPCHVTADHPKSCDVLFVTSRDSRSVLRFPSLVSSVRETTAGVCTLRWYPQTHSL